MKKIPNPGNLSVLGFSQYNVTKQGSITNVCSGQTLKPFVDRHGYENYSLWGDDGARKTVRCHQLVAKMFVPNPGQHVQVDHIDGNKRNNTVENLNWVSNLENAHRAMANGLMPHSVFNDDQVKQICQRLENGESQSQISRDMDVPRSAVAAIKLRRNWKHISKDYEF